jgi:predicted ester cyclase
MGSGKDLLRELFEASDEGRYDRAVELIGNGVVHLPGQPPLDAAAWRQFSETFTGAFSDAEHTLDVLLEEGNRVAIEGTWSGTHVRPFITPQGEVPPSGTRITMGWCGFFTRRDDGIEGHVYFDQMDLAEKLGMIPATA